jgi:hypothetical protein
MIGSPAAIYLNFDILPDNYNRAIASNQTPDRIVMVGHNLFFDVSCFAVIKREIGTERRKV